MLYLFFVCVVLVYGWVGDMYGVGWQFVGVGDILCVYAYNFNQYTKWFKKKKKKNRESTPGD